MVAKWYAANPGKTLDEFTKLALRIGSQLPPGSTVLEVAPPGLFLHRARQARSVLDRRTRHQPYLCRTRAQESRQGGRARRLPARQCFRDALRERYFRLPLVPRGFQELRTAGSCLARKCAACSKVDAMGLSTVNTILTKLAFRTMLLKNTYTREQFQHMLAQATFHRSEERRVGKEC